MEQRNYLDKTNKGVHELCDARAEWMKIRIDRGRVIVHQIKRGVQVTVHIRMHGGRSRILNDRRGRGKEGKVTARLENADPAAFSHER